jgi:hypothetical protein
VASYPCISETSCRSRAVTIVISEACDSPQRPVVYRSGLGQHQLRALFDSIARKFALRVSVACFCSCPTATRQREMNHSAWLDHSSGKVMVARYNICWCPSENGKWQVERPAEQRHAPLGWRCARLPTG